MEEPEKGEGIFLYTAEVSENLQRIFNQHNVPVYFKPTNRLRQVVVHPKDNLPREKQRNDLYTGETKQPLHKHMAQHRRTCTLCQDHAVGLHFEENGHYLEDHNVRILIREERWFERGAKEVIFVKVEKPSLNRRVQVCKTAVPQQQIEVMKSLG